MTLKLPRELINDMVKRHLKDFITTILDYTIQTEQEEEFIDKLPRVFLVYLYHLIYTFSSSYEESINAYVQMFEKEDKEEQKEGDQ